MKDEQIDRLLDEGLKNYSRVEPPEQLAQSILASVQSAGQEKAGKQSWRPRVWGRWPIWAPALAALLVVLGLLVWRAPRTDQPRSASVNRTATAPTGPKVAQAEQPPASEAHPWQAAGDEAPEVRHARAATAKGAAHKTAAARPSYRVLTPEELAKMKFTPDMFPQNPPPVELAVPALNVPDLKVAPIEVRPIESEKGMD